MTESEVASYVESIMSSQRVNRVNTPDRKRNRSEPNVTDNVCDTANKKPRVFSSARRVLDNGPQSGGSNDMTEAQGNNKDIQLLISNLAADLHMQFAALNERMDKLENGLEQKIASKVAQILDKRVSSEMTKIRKEVDVKIDNVKRDIHAEVAAELESVNDRIKEVASAPTNSTSSDDIALNIVIRELPESNSENTLNKVNSLIKDGLKLNGVECVTAERKKNRDSRKSGVVIARFKTHDDKRKVMLQKKLLRDNRQYSGVFINHDQSLAERRMSDSFRSILGVLKNNNLVIRGSRVVRVNQQNDADTYNRDRRGSNNSVNDRGVDNRNNHNNDRRGGSIDNNQHSFQVNDGWQRASSARGNNRGGNQGRGQHRGRFQGRQ